MHATLYTDGGARGNPGPAGIGYVLKVGTKKPVLYKRYIGETTNNQAEYRALLAGLKKAREERVSALECFLDSELVVRQLNGLYKIKNEDLKPLAAEINALVRDFSQVSFVHVRREKNSVADKLVNEAIDKHVNAH